MKGGAGAGLWATSAIAALGALLFGYDLGVISGAQSFLAAEFDLSAKEIQFAVASVNVGAIIGSMFGGRFADRLGRKRALVWLGVLFGVGAVATSLAPSFVAFLVIRVIVGLAAGASVMITPMYLTESAPPELRGRIGSLSQTAIGVGLFVSYLSGYLFTVTGGGWRPMFAAALVPAVVLVVGFRRLDETPRWLVGQGRVDEGRQALLDVGTAPDLVDTEIAAIRESLSEASGARFREFRHPGLRACLTVAVVLGVAQQFVGPNTVLFYAPRVLIQAGFASQDKAILATALIGAVNLVATLVTFSVVDRIGRKPLLLIGFAGMSLSLGAEVLIFLGGHPDPALALVFFLIYIAFFGLSISPVGWLLSSEIFPNRVRGIGSSVASSMNQASSLLVSLTFLSLAGALGFSGAFGIYAVLGVGFLVFTVVAVPETNGRTLEQISRYWYQNRTWPEEESHV